MTDWLAIELQMSNGYGGIETQITFAPTNAVVKQEQSPLNRARSVNALREPSKNYFTRFVVKLVVIQKRFELFYSLSIPQLQTMAMKMLHNTSSNVPEE